MDAPPVQFCTTSDGMSIAYSVAGKGLPLVYMGLPINHKGLAWKLNPKRLSYLAERFTLIQYDCRGQGLSSRNVPPLTIPSYVLDLETIVAHLGLQRFVLIASGFHCDVAVRYSVANPEADAGLVLTGAWTRSDHALNTNIQQLARNNWDTYLTVATQTISRTMEVPIEMEDAKRSVLQADFVNHLSAFAESDMTALLPKVAWPTLVVAPSGDLPYYIPEATQIASLVPHARLLITPAEQIKTGYAQILEAFVNECGINKAEDVPGGTAYREDSASLSPRELQLVALLAAGLTNQQIADELIISLNTVRRHVSNIFVKIGAANRADAVSYAHRHGLIDPS